MIKNLPALPYFSPAQAATDIISFTLLFKQADLLELPLMMEGKLLRYADSWKYFTDTLRSIAENAQHFEEIFIGDHPQKALF